MKNYKVVITTISGDGKLVYEDFDHKFEAQAIGFYQSIKISLGNKDIAGDVIDMEMVCFESDANGIKKTVLRSLFKDGIDGIISAMANI